MTGAEYFRIAEAFLEHCAAKGLTTIAEARREASAGVVLEELRDMYPECSGGTLREMVADFNEKTNPPDSEEIPA